MENKSKVKPFWLPHLRLRRVFQKTSQNQLSLQVLNTAKDTNRLWDKDSQARKLNSNKKKLKILNWLT